VAAFLSSVFPNLASIFMDRKGRDVELRKEWSGVETALPVLREVRAEEKYWMGRGRK
jgi:hypothetical protein